MENVTRQISKSHRMSWNPIFPHFSKHKDTKLYCTEKMSINSLHSSLFNEIVKYLPKHYLFFALVCQHWRAMLQYLFHNSNETAISTMTHSINCFEFAEKSLRMLLATRFIDKITLINIIGKAFGIIIQHYNSEILHFTCPDQIDFVTAILRRPCKKFIFPILRVIAAIRLDSLDLVEESIFLQKFFSGLFIYKMGNDNARRPIVCFLIEISGVDFIIGIANRNNYVLTSEILEIAIMYLSTDIIRELCQRVRVEIDDELELKRLFQFPILMADTDQISLLRDLCILMFGSDIMTGIIISMFPENGNRNVLVHVFTALISGISFSDYGKARLIVVLALREQEAHLLTLRNESPFTLAWCFEFINNYDNHIALEYMTRFHRRNVL